MSNCTCQFGAMSVLLDDLPDDYNPHGPFCPYTTEDRAKAQRYTSGRDARRGEPSAIDEVLRLNRTLHDIEVMDTYSRAYEALEAGHPGAGWIAYADPFEGAEWAGDQYTGPIYREA